MTFSTRFGFHWVAPLAVAGLLAGCQSSRTAFQFTPAAPYAPASQPAAAPATLAAVTDASAPAQPLKTPAAAAARAAGRPAPLRRAVQQLVARPVPGGTRVAVSTPAVVAPGEVAVASRPHRHRAALAHTQESGLKRIFFFFLAVVLGVLAGLGALLSLIPGVSFFGGVGLAAAGLLLLFLLYSLLSGGKKKGK